MRLDICITATWGRPVPYDLNVITLQLHDDICMYIHLHLPFFVWFWRMCSLMTSFTPIVYVCGFAWFICWWYGWFFFKYSLCLTGSNILPYSVLAIQFAYNVLIVLTNDFHPSNFSLLFSYCLQPFTYLLHLSFPFCPFSTYPLFLCFTYLNEF